MNNLSLYIELETEKYPINIDYIIAKFSNISFPISSLGQIDFEKFGYKAVHSVEKPVINEYTQNCIERVPKKIDNEYYQVFEVVEKSEEEKDVIFNKIKIEKLEAINKEKIKLRDGGFPVNNVQMVNDTIQDGVVFDSDALARISYTDFLNICDNIPSNSSLWKASEGVWVVMTKELVNRVQQRGYEHYTSIYIWQATKDAEINNCNTIEDILLVKTTIN